MSSERAIRTLGFSVGISNANFILEAFCNYYFTLFSPRSGLSTIREKTGTSSWVLVR